MMRYSYFPGCSLDSTARPYGESVEAVASALGMELVEVDDWNCCGATAYMGVNEILAFSLGARNLCQASKIGAGPLVTPCSACFTNLRKTDKYMAEFPDVRKKVDAALAEAGLRYEGGMETKHLLQVIVEDVGLESLKRAVRKPLAGLRVAPYYGCQIARPYGIEDDSDDPQMLDRMLDALGATPTRFPMKTVCCGGSLIGTREEVALRLCRNLLMCAQQDGADCVAVACPVCQINLDAYQAAINKSYDLHFDLPIVYFTQLIGLALGLDSRSLGLQRCIVPATKVVSRFA
jgi:heterodisulfide reductase subunit B